MSSINIAKYFKMSTCDELEGVSFYTLPKVPTDEPNKKPVALSSFFLVFAIVKVTPGGTCPQELGIELIALFFVNRGSSETSQQSCKLQCPMCHVH